MIYYANECEEQMEDMQAISRIDTIIERLSSINNYSKEMSLRAEELRVTLDGETKASNQADEKVPVRGGKLGNIDAVISDIFNNLDRLQSTISRIEKII